MSDTSENLDEIARVVTARAPTLRETVVRSRTFGARFVLIAVVVVALGAAGCGGGDDTVATTQSVTTADGMYVYPEAVKASFRKAFIQGRGEPWITAAQCILDYAQAHWTVEKFQSVAASDNPDRQAAVNACQP